MDVLYVYMFTGLYRHGFPGNDKTTKLKISRANVAAFMLKNLSTIRIYIRHMVSLTEKNREDLVLHMIKCKPGAH